MPDWWPSLDTASKFAPICTALIALAAVIIAWLAIQAQKDIARKRAAIDFFIKTETDGTLIEMYGVFKEEIQDVKWGMPIDAFVKKENYLKVRAFLNLCELIAVGIRRDAFSDDVSFHYWGDVLRDAFRDARPLIDYVRTEENKPATYCDLEWVCRERWHDRV